MSHQAAPQVEDAELRELRRRQRHWREVEQRRRAARLNAPLAEPDPEPAIQRDLKALTRAEEEATRARADADAARKAEDREGHKEALGRLKAAQSRIRTLRLSINSARTAQIDRRWVETAKGETEALAKLRGEELEDEDTEVAEWLRDPESGALVKGDEGLPVLRAEKARARRVLSRSGLDRAFVRGDLGEGVQTAIRLREIGRQYGAAYQAATSMLTPDAHEVRGTGVPEPQMSTLTAWNMLSIMRGSKTLDGVQLKALTPKQREILDRVCGNGEAVGMAARAIRSGVPSAIRALRAGLEVAGDNLSAAMKHRTVRLKIAA